MRLSEKELLIASPEMATRPLARAAILGDKKLSRFFMRYVNEMENAALCPEPRVASWCVHQLWEHYLPLIRALKPTLSQTINGYTPYAELHGAMRNVYKNMMVKSWLPQGVTVAMGSHDVRRPYLAGLDGTPPSPTNPG